MNWYNYTTDIYDSRVALNNVIHFQPSNKPNYTNTKFNTGKSTFLLIIEFNSSKDSGFDDLANYLIFDLVDIKGNLIIKDKLINKMFNTFQFEELEVNEEYFIIHKSGCFPFGLHYSIYSDHNLVSINFNNYLKDYFNYSIYNFKNEHSFIKSNTFYCFDRLSLNVS